MRKFKIADKLFFLSILAVFILQTYYASGRLWANDRLVRPFSSSCITVYKDRREPHYTSGRSKSFSASSRRIMRLSPIFIHCYTGRTERTN